MLNVCCFLKKGSGTRTCRELAHLGHWYLNSNSGDGYAKNRVCVGNFLSTPGVLFVFTLITPHDPPAPFLLEPPELLKFTLLGPHCGAAPSKGSLANQVVGIKSQDPSVTVNDQQAHVVIGFER